MASKVQLKDRHSTLKFRKNNNLVYYLFPIYDKIILG